MIFVIIVLILIYADSFRLVALVVFIILIVLMENKFVIAAVAMKIPAAIVSHANHVIYVADAAVALLKKRR